MDQIVLCQWQNSPSKSRSWRLRGAEGIRGVRLVVELGPQSLDINALLHVCFSGGLVMDKGLHVQLRITIQADAAVQTAT